MKNLFFVFVMFIGMSLSASAATIIVTTAAGDNTAGSFRNVFTNAEDGDIIEFNIAGEDVITLAGACTRTKGSTTITINGINKATGKPIVLDIKGTNSIYRSNSGASGVHINFNDLIFRNGKNSSAGGGILLGNSAHTARSTVKFRNCTFEGCESGAQGGALAYNQWTDLTVENCTFINNKATTSGGAVASASSSNNSAVLSNCTFYNNEAITSGGAFFSNSAVATPVVNCTFVGNKVTGTTPQGGGAFADANGQTTFVNCILAGNSPDDVFGKRTNLKYCIVQTIGETETIKINSEENAVLYAASVFAGGIAELKDNGGFTKTRALVGINNFAYYGGNPVYAGTGSALYGLNKDQREVLRNVPNPSIGAFDIHKKIITHIITNRNITTSIKK